MSTDSKALEAARILEKRIAQFPGTGEMKSEDIKRNVISAMLEYAALQSSQKEGNSIDVLLLAKAKELNIHVDFSDKSYDGDKEAPMDRYGFLEYLLKQKEGWVSVSDKPLVTWETMDDRRFWTCTPEGEKEFIAAVPYTGKKHPGKELWWIRHCVIEDGVGLCVVGDVDNDPAGWEISDVTHYSPLPSPPIK